MNQSFIHADIFFFITTIVVLVFSALLIIFFYYIVKIARHLEHTTKRLRDEGDRIIDDLSAVRESFENQGNKVASVLRLIFGSFLGSKMGSYTSGSNKKGKRSSKTKEESDE